MDIIGHLINSIPEQSLGPWYRRLTYFAIGLPILGGLCGYIASMVSNRISDLQATALQHAQDTAEEAREAAMPRRLLPKDAARMLDVARQFCSKIKRVPVTAANGDQEAQAYASDFVKLFVDAGCTSDLQLPIPGLTPDVEGVRIGVRNLTDIPAEVGLIDKMFLAGGIRYQVNPLTADFFPDEAFVLIIGVKPKSRKEHPASPAS
jgi:hypothetical protein